MTSLLDTPPDSVRAIAEMQLPQEDNNHNIEQSAPPHRETIISLKADIAANGTFGERWLIVDRSEAKLISVESGGKASIENVVAVEDIISAITIPHAGNGVLHVHVVGGKVIELARYTPSRARQFGLAARVLDALATDRPIDKLLEEELPIQICPTCGIPLEQGTLVCPFCINPGASLIRLFKYGKPYVPQVILMVMLSFMGTAISLLSPYLTTKVLTDQVLLPHRHESWIFWLVLGALLLACLGTGLNVWRGRVAAFLSNHMVYCIRKEVYDKLQELSVSYFDKRQVGTLLTRVTQDVNELQRFLVDGIQVFFVNSLTIVGIFIVMFKFNPALTLLAIIPAPFIILLTRVIWKKLGARLHRMYYLRSKLSGLIAAALSGVRVVRAFNQENHERDRFDGRATALFKSQLVVEQSWATVFPLLATFATCGTFFIYFYGGVQVFHHTTIAGKVMTLGTLQLFLVYLGLMMGPIQSLSSIADWLTRSSTSAERVYEILDAPVEVASGKDAKKAPRIKGAVELQDVWFSYDKATDVLQGVSLKVEAGEMIGLVGRSGAGKSTLINLLSRFYDVSEGEILIDGVDIRKIDLNDLRNQVGVVLQEPFLFPGTVRDNIAYSRPNATFEEIASSAKKANAHDFIMRLPDAYDTYVGERGARLSGGERQRISIARAILHNPRILILDEATASVDTETEKQIQDAISFLVRGRTTFAIAHRLSTLRNADRLVVLEKGKIVEVGSHEELIEKPDGAYRRLVEMQSAINKLREENMEIE